MVSIGLLFGNALSMVMFCYCKLLSTIRAPVNLFSVNLSLYLMFSVLNKLLASPTLSKYGNLFVITAIFPFWLPCFVGIETSWRIALPASSDKRSVLADYSTVNLLSLTSVKNKRWKMVNFVLFRLSQLIQAIGPVKNCLICGKISHSSASLWWNVTKP